MTDGIINVNKPAGWTSQDVCSKLRHVLKIKKAGHTGTLDPMATGVLPICFGKATRIIEYYDRDAKSYHASMKLGITTDTLDITGEVTSERKVRIVSDESEQEEQDDLLTVTEQSIRKAFAEYTGVISQIPPKYSALKIGGKRAYELARAGEEPEMKAREITVHSIGITDIDPDTGTIEFDVSCSKGTYIRSICDDIGNTLGCGAVMTALTRTASGYFRIEDSYTIEEIIEAATATMSGNSGNLPEGMTIPADVTLQKLGKVILNDNRVIAFKNGNSTYASGFRMITRSDFDELYRVYTKDGAFLGVAAVCNGSLIPQKVLADNQDQNNR